MSSAFLPQQRQIEITGKDAQEFLNNLITTDVENLPENEVRAGALLTPQGKILFDFLVSREADGFILETDSSQLDALIRRLTMYKLRAAVEIKPHAQDGVSVFWDGDKPEGAKLDSRFAKAGIELYRAAGASASGAIEPYDALRISVGIVHSGADYALQDAFPHDVLMDVNDGVSFKKGCFVGQEVVSRMKHRGTARRRVVIVESDAPLPAGGTDLTVNGKTIGTLGSVSGNNGVAIVRIDRVADALATETPILAGETPVKLTLPAWSGLSFPAAEPTASAEE
ncbi:CAF17-like 4Fe-4S cluster assembly/insertion protein YgfZ [Agrobacterium sp. Azo12]|jgi:folate-binding protein YgfZ|uniref:CAF17-like 4Fe-4S cluster assembly/insertion protein YgfZ n=1 Tax=Agrobacterium sp. Azo12 TaxID=3031129 RepID=UPI0023D80865|nr:folate-binding protein YgfZ [Agrobacterium sp. Azo12]MDO5894953.1 folate-binding protein YgfZ [Agrobacterium sp. Azo12]